MDNNPGKRDMKKKITFVLRHFPEVIFLHICSVSFQLYSEDARIKLYSILKVRTKLHNIIFYVSNKPENALYHGLQYSEF